MKKSMLLFILICFGLNLNAQTIRIMDLDSIHAQTEAADQWGLEAFMAVVLSNHPVVKQAGLLPELARQSLIRERGAFDPKLEATWDVKHFKDTDYYDLFSSSLKVPTWFPVDPKISVDRNKGVFLNPENSIPGSDDFRQVTAGLSLPLGRGLLIDQRRAAVKQAQIFQDINEAERIKMVNKVLLQAGKAYWDWYYAYFNLRIVEGSLDISAEIYRRVRLDFDLGEAAAIDTVQAAITLQNRETDRYQALINFQVAGLQLSNYLWGENEEPLEMSNGLVPKTIALDSQLPKPELLDSLLLQAREQHPELIKINRKLDQLVVEERLARENLKPRVDLDYNVINAPLDASGDLVDLQLRNNYKFGLRFELPLFLRKERSKLKETRIKIDQTQYSLVQTRREVVNDIESAFVVLRNTADIFRLTRQSVTNYQRLLEAEIFNLNNGESDLFMINFQQDKLLESQTKLMKVLTSFEKARLELVWSAGTRQLNFSEPYLD